MLNTLFASIIGEALTPAVVLAAVGAALALGLLISVIYYKTHEKEGYQVGFAITLVMLPAIICIIIMLIGNNVARAFSLAGAFSLIRFRSAPGDPKDIAYVFFTMSVGLACGMGYLAYGLAFAIIMCTVMVLLHHTNFASPKTTGMQLKITIPEDLNFQGLFDDILAKYTSGWTLKRVKTSEFGTLFEVVFSINLNENADQKQFFDELRCRNGNLNILLTMKEYEQQSIA